VSPSSVFQERVALTARQLRAFPARFLSECTLFPDTIHRGGEVFFRAGMAQVLAAIEAERAEPQSAPTKKAARDNHGSNSEHFNELIDNLSRIAG